MYINELSLKKIFWYLVMKEKVENATILISLVKEIYEKDIKDSEIDHFKDLGVVVVNNFIGVVENLQETPLKGVAGNTNLIDF